jgi:altronate dehydratase
MILGYATGSRGVEIRNHQLILPSVLCSTHLARKKGAFYLTLEL